MVALHVPVSQYKYVCPPGFESEVLRMAGRLGNQAVHAIVAPTAPAALPGDGSQSSDPHTLEAADEEDPPSDAEAGDNFPEPTAGSVIPTTLVTYEATPVNVKILHLPPSSCHNLPPANYSLVVLEPGEVNGKSALDGSKLRTVLAR